LDNHEPNQARLLDATMELLPSLLNSLDALMYAGRHLHPPRLPELAEEVGVYEAPLLRGMVTFEGVAWPEHLGTFALHTKMATSLALDAIAAFAQASAAVDPVIRAYQAMGDATRAYAAAYPLASMLPPVNRFYLEPDFREDPSLLAKLDEADGDRDGVGVMHADNAADQRGGFSIYVPEYYAGERVPLIIALHGGGGHGRNFLWSWLRAARTSNCILIAPTSDDRTWSLMDPSAEHERLQRLTAYACAHWQIDEDRVLLTGMSDGGTFSYVSGLHAEAAYTHLAPCSASFHPMLLEAVDRRRVEALPIYLTHGALDWMFPVTDAQQAKASLDQAGAKVVYREIADLSHTYPWDENMNVIDWLRS